MCRWGSARLKPTPQHATNYTCEQEEAAGGSWKLQLLVTSNKGPKINKPKMSWGTTALTAKDGQGKGRVTKKTQQ